MKMKQKNRVAAIVLFCTGSILSVSVFADRGTTATHKVSAAETPWFLAQVYYGNGAEFSKLLKTNHMTRPEEMREGIEIQIENPKFQESDPQFQKRYSDLWDKRSKALGLKIDNRMPSSKVVIPTQKIRSKDNTPNLPFTEVKDTGRSASQMANDELHLIPRRDAAQAE